MCADAVLSEPWRGRRRSASGGDGALDADRAADHDERARRKALASKIAGCVAAHWRAFGAAFEGPAKEAKTLFDLGRVEDDSDDDEPAAAVVVAAVAGGRRPSLSDAARRCLLATAAVLHAQPASAPSSSSSSSPRNRPTNDDSLPSAPLSPLSATLLPHQRAAAAAVLTINRLQYGAYLHGKPAVGKTALLAVTIDAWLRAGDGGAAAAPVLLLAPRRGMLRWLAELQRRLPACRVRVLSGSSESSPVPRRRRRTSRPACPIGSSRPRCRCSWPRSSRRWRSNS